MCIAIVSESGVKLPTKKVLKRCFENNPDGAGYGVYLAEEKWECKKGFETWNSFWKAFKQENYSKDDTVIIHFRIGTSGKKGKKNQNNHPDCTHPFPITDNEADLMQHHFVADNILMHNGTCGKGKDDLSDTMLAIINYVDPLLPYIDSDKMFNILEKCIGNTSRWFITKGKYTWMIGDWEKDKDTGIWYSNKGYLPQPKTTYQHYTYTGSKSHWYPSGYRVEAEIKYLESSKLLFCDNGKWSWDKWNQLTTPLLAAPKPTSMIDMNKTYETYDEQGQLSALIDIDGNIVWERPEDTSKDFDCPYCANKVRDNIMSAFGECPYCYEVVSIPPDNNEKNDRLVCPFCGETEYLIEPNPYVVSSEVECVKCGSIFDEETDEIIGWISSNTDRGGRHVY